MELLLYNFTKKSNSTAIPQGEPAVRVNVVLKSGNVSKHSPVLELQHPLSRLYDYAYFDSTWYWVRDFAFNEYNRYTLYLEIDVLATYREWIMDTPNYCLRTSVAYNGNINDDMQAADTRRYQLSLTHRFLESRTPAAGGSVLVNISGRTGGQWYVLQNGVADVMRIYNILYSQKQSELWEQIRGLFSENQLTNVIDLANYINDIVCLPFEVRGYGDLKELYLGYFGTGVRALECPMICYTGTGSLDFLHPPDTDLDGPFFYQRNAPYCTYDIYVPCCGTYKIDSGLMSQIDFINYAYWVDCLGNITIHFIIQGQVVAYGGGNCAFRMPAGQRTTTGTITQMVQNTIGALPNPLTALSTLYGGVADMSPTGGSFMSASGNATSWQDPDIHMMTHYYTPVKGFDYGRLGYPYYATIIPKRNGYYLFKDAHIAAGELWENEAIEKVLNSGIIIE